MSESPLRLRVNGRDEQVLVGSEWTLLEVLRAPLHLHGTKDGCGTGACGACTVWIDGQPRLSCITLARSVEGSEITTIEGLAPAWQQEQSQGGEAPLHPLQDAAIEEGAVQCGFCTPGMMMAGAALLRENPAPTRDEIRESLSGHLCRCTGYEQIVRAVERATVRMGEGELHDD